MQAIYLSDTTLNDLQNVACLRGLNTDVYAEELLAISLAVLRETGTPTVRKPHRAIEFGGIAPTQRTAAGIEADIEEQRKDWNE